jgi:hypothetical protein
MQWRWILAKTLLILSAPTNRRDERI